MAEDSNLEYQKFIAKREGMLGSIYSSCKKRLEENPKLKSEELFRQLGNEFKDIYYQDKLNWLIYIKQIKRKILQESQEPKEMVQSETIGINNKEVPQTSLSHLAGDTHIEKSLPYHDKDDYEPPENMRVVIPPREEKPPQEVQLDLDLEGFKPTPKKDETRLSPFGKIR